MAEVREPSPDDDVIRESDKVMNDEALRAFRTTPAMLCANCLQGDAGLLPVGQEYGSQRDPERSTVALCRSCASALVAGDFGGLYENHASERTIRRG